MMISTKTGQAPAVFSVRPTARLALLAGAILLPSALPESVAKLLAGSTDGAIIQDNGAPGTSKKGTWTAIANATTYGPNALVSQRSASYTYKPAVASGNYNVFLWWPVLPTLSRSTRVSVFAVDGKYSFTVNQRVNGGRWNLLGTFDLNGTSSVQISSSKAPACADAVLFEPVMPSPSPMPAPDLPPAAPAGLLGSAGDLVVSLDWADNAEPDLAAYRVYRSTTSGAGYALIAQGLTVSAFQDTTVSDDVAHYYVVTAVDAIGQESAPSAEAAATPEAPVQFPPPIPDPSPVSSVTLAWGPPTLNADGTPLMDLSGYKIYQGSTSGQYSIVLDMGNVTQVSIGNLSSGQTYYFVATAYDITGNESTPTSEVSITIP